MGSYGEAKLFKNNYYDEGCAEGGASPAQGVH